MLTEVKIKTDCWIPVEHYLPQEESVIVEVKYKNGLTDASKWINPDFYVYDASTNETEIVAWRYTGKSL